MIVLAPQNAEKTMLYILSCLKQRLTGVSRADKYLRKVCLLKSTQNALPEKAKFCFFIQKTNSCGFWFQ